VIAVTLSALALAASGTEAGLHVAQATWGVPACGQPHVEMSTPSNYMRAHEGVSIEDQPVAWADEKRCAIVINPNWKIYTATKRCHIVVHEYGHLAGHGHSDNTRSVMYREDQVAENFDIKTDKLVAFGAFKPCYAATRNEIGSKKAHTLLPTKKLTSPVISTLIAQ
jgi:hypothetical protein